MADFKSQVQEIIAQPTSAQAKVEALMALLQEGAPVAAPPKPPPPPPRVEGSETRPPKGLMGTFGSAGSDD